MSMEANNIQEAELREQDRWLPIANVARLMKNTLPATAKVSKDAKECMQECVSEFISFITSEASDKCLKEKRKTINGEDILYSMHDLGFENYAEVLKIYLAKYREQQALKQERNETGSKRLKKSTVTESGVGVTLEDQNSFNSPVPDEISTREHENMNDQNFGNNEDGSHQDNIYEHASIGQNSSASSVQSNGPFFTQYDSSDIGLNRIADNGNINSHQKIEGYHYDDFINENSENHITSQQRIDDITKQIASGEESDIDSLATGITNGNTHEEYF